MNAIRISRRLDSHVVELPELVGLVGKRLEIIILEEPDPAEPVPAGPTAGCGMGEVLWMAPDFNGTPKDFADHILMRHSHD